ncbi:hypothetical protein ACFE04_003582 [Oxalis oulophora]
MEHETKTVPLLGVSNDNHNHILHDTHGRGSGRGRGSSSKIEALGNIIVSIVGTGILGLPFAFKTAGWLAASIAILIAALSTYYCMLLLVECRDKVASQNTLTQSITYGDLGYNSIGKTGRFFTEFLICISQCGGSVAYLVFIGQNLSTLFPINGLNFSTFIFFLVPIEVVLSWVDSLTAFAPFSTFATICNMLAMLIVLKFDVQEAISRGFSFSGREAITPDLKKLPFVLGMAVFCFEGFGLTLALEASMKERKTFPKLLAKALTGITFIYVVFAFFGYMAFGDQTQDIVTLNLPQNWWAMAVQVGLCLGLAFTFPVMVHPVHEIVEDKIKSSSWFTKLYDHGCGNLRRNMGKALIYLSRAIIVTTLAVVASFVPGFGSFVSLVGSTPMALTTAFLEFKWKIDKLYRALED